MKSPVLSSLIIASAGLLIAGCNRSDSDARTAANDTGSAVESGASQLSAATSNAWDEVKDYSYDRREELADRIERNYDNLRATVNDRSAKERLDEAGDRLREAAREVRVATRDNWDDAKDKLRAAWNDVRDRTAQSVAE